MALNHTMQHMSTESAEIGIRIYYVYRIEKDCTASHWLWGTWGHHSLHVPMGFAHGVTTPCTSLWGIAHGVTTPCMSLWDTEHRDTIPFFSHGIYWFSLCVLQWGGRAQWRNYFAWFAGMWDPSDHHLLQQCCTPRDNSPDSKLFK